MKNLRHVEFAVVLARHRNFARAAESMNVTQPTLSRGIAALEAELGARLFDRSTRRVEPTSAGLTFLEHADALLADATRLRDSIRDHSDLLTGQLAVAAGPYPLELSVIPAISLMATRHPKLRFQLVEGRWRSFVGLLLSGVVEIVVMETTVLAGDHRLDVEPLPRHPGILVCRPRHPLAGRSRVSLSDLGPYPLVGVPTVREVQWRIGAFGRRLDVDHVTGDVNPHITVTSNASMREIVRSTDGIGLCAALRVEDDLRARRLVALEADFELPTTAYGIVQLHGRSLSPAAQAFAKTLREVEAGLQRRDEQAFAVKSRGRSRRRRTRSRSG